ncbi:MAG: hypothetical protein FWG58_03065 [Methanomassiliicoccaceae archaeon]|nr:hypothetical protein [Methanomassiliicoccaceae archaeon]
MYQEHAGLILGFHGCGRWLAEKVLLGSDDFTPSDKPYDWLGRGVYFWDRDPRRALEFALKKGSVEPSVVGAIIDPGRCLDLRCRDSQEMIRTAYEKYCKDHGTPEQKNASYEEGVPLRRNLDFAMIEAACMFYQRSNDITFDTVIGTFLEGKEIYPGAGIRDKTHTQICVRNPDCILGYFNPKSMR